MIALPSAGRSRTCAYRIAALACVLQVLAVTTALACSCARPTLEELLQYYHAIKPVNGMMITLWHNTYLGTEKVFEGWREAYARFIKEIAE